MKKLNLLNIVKKLNLEKEMLKGNFGLEKENLRVNSKGELALTPHPKEFGNKAKNPYITVDFSESQLEMITPALPTVEETYSFLENLHDIVSTTLDGEYIWPQSIPAILPDEKNIPIASFENEEGKKAKEYREALSKKYGQKLQLLSGIHYNFSFKEETLKKLYENIDINLEYKEFKDEIYLKIARNYFRYGWLLIYLLGASSPIHETYRKRCLKKMSKFTDGLYYFENTLSFRNGVCGYKNIEEFYVSHNSTEEYIKDLKNLIEEGVLKEAREYYSSIRLKAKDNSDILSSIEKDGIKYLEVRSIDLNPFSRIGIDINDLHFVHLFLLYCLFKEESEFGEEEYKISKLNQEITATMGRDENLLFYKDGKIPITLKDWAEEILTDIREFLKDMNIEDEKYFKALDYQINKIKFPEKQYVSMLLKGIEEEGFSEFHINKAKEYLKDSKEKSFALKGYEDLELSSQIVLKEAIKRGVKFEIIDRSENFILLDNGIKKEYVKQATKTSLDSYSTVLIMENKVVTKKVLKDQGITIPEGSHYENAEEAKDDFERYKDMQIVIKPKSTNFGLGITIFKDKFTKAEYTRAVDIAFNEDNTILIEKFVKGKEYRFFVLGDETVGILHRVPANVLGDGKRTIRELVQKKNMSPLRGKGYKTPLEKINLGESEEMFLKNHGKVFDYIPKNNELVYLRENSNISTGGDSIDYTDDIPQIYKDIAVKSAKAAGATICGVDMMINDIKNENPDNNYAIIEINFNPAIHIHCYPYKGKNRKVGEKILDALGF